MNTTLATIEADIAAVVAQAGPIVTMLESVAPILAMFLPEPEALVVTKVIGILKAIPTAAPNLGSDANALIADIKAVIATL